MMTTARFLRFRRWSARLPLLLLVAVVAVGTGCGSKRDRLALKQAEQALKGGNPKAAASQTKQVLQNSPRNILALRLLSKIKSALLKQAEADVKSQNYDKALENLQTLLELEPDHKKAQALQQLAKKHKAVADARTAQANRELGTALELVRQALAVDPDFPEAQELRGTLLEQRDDEIERLLGRAPQLLQQGEPATVVEEMQQVLKLDPDQAQAADLLREAQVALLAKEKRENLDAARAFYAEGRYEAAIEKAEAILAVDETSFEAKSILERAKAESERPELLLTGISSFRGTPTAAVEVPSLDERAIVKVGDEIGPYRVARIDPQAKIVEFEFIPTGSILSYSTVRE